MGGIPPSIAALVMRCKVLLSLSIQRIRGGLRWPLYCCTSGPPLSLLPSNIEARVLLKASFCLAPAAIFSCRRPMCFRRAPAAIFFCRHPTMLLTPRSHCDLFQPNCSSTATLPSFDAAMSLLFKSCRSAAIFCYCSIMAGWCNFLPLAHHCSVIFSLLLLLPNISQGEFSFASVTLTFFHFWKKTVSLLMICRLMSALAMR
jgi:hypothetical protein